MANTVFGNYLESNEGETELYNFLESHLSEVFPNQNLDNEQNCVLIDSHVDSEVEEFLYDTLVQRDSYIQNIQENGTEVRVSVSTEIIAQISGTIVDNSMASADEEHGMREGSFQHDQQIPLELDLIFNLQEDPMRNGFSSALIAHDNLILNDGNDVRVDVNNIEPTMIEWGD